MTTRLEDYLTTAIVAARLDASPRTVARWCEIGLLNGAVKIAGEHGIWLIPPTALDNFERPQMGPKEIE